ncbi:MAG TPA: TIM barrel protein [Blastocatellia bacterium]|nr:TIM barrel protein [Blastocatellia bacterium]HMV84274.1 TIM barrel protein [Blastocatellia bacterium]HMX28821.1 TIM barrel protein [Blastocatellia bacterium]HNG34129.1 TIM barrel protein [Blastocatellia bacterium]
MHGKLFCFLMAMCALGVTGVAAEPQTIYLWPAGHPTLQGANEKEIINPPDPKPGQFIRQFKNIHNPSLEVFPAPRDKATGAALIVAAGGGHRELNTGTEGYDLIEWLHGMGVSVFILKYRLAFTPNYKYTVEGEALQDTQRAIRIVRGRAAEWNINPTRIGLLGFSAGGALAALADIRFDRGKPDATDPIEHQSCRPDFVGLVYAGWAPMDITAPPDAAPAFLTSAGVDDAFHARQTVEFFTSLFKVNVPADLHIYARGGHAGGIKPRDGIPFGTWHHRFAEWLADIGMLNKFQTGTGLSFKGPIGVQLYSLRENFAKDVAGTLDQARGFGIENVELAGTYNLPPEKFKAMLDAKGLKPISAHFPFEKFRDNVEAVAAEAKVLGVQYVGCAWIPHQTFDEKTAREAAAVFNRAGEALAKHGLKFFYHIHGYEFQPHGAGTLFDLLMAETRPQFVRYEMDVFWVVHPGQDPVKLLEKYGNRFELMHVKDMKKGTPTGVLTGTSDVKNDVAIGTGQMNWPAILKAAQKAGVKHYFLEDESPTSVQQIPLSLRYLEKVKF